MIDHILDENSVMWKSIESTCNKEYATRVVHYDALDAVLMDDEINRVLKVMFPNTEIKAHDYIMKWGWKNYNKK